MRKNHIIDDLLHPRIVVLVILVVAGTIVLHVLVGENAKKDVDFGAVIISGAGIVYTVLLTVQSKRASSAARFAERWNDADFTERRHSVGQVIRGEQENRSDRHQARDDRIKLFRGNVYLHSDGRSSRGDVEEVLSLTSDPERSCFQTLD
jgi:hypothetical protein